MSPKNAYRAPSPLEPPPRPWSLVLVVTLVAAALFTIRLAAPGDLRDNDQERPASYSLDALVNGNWIVMADQTGDIMSKPPVSTWITAGLAAPFRTFNLFFLYLPSFLAVLGIAWLILAFGAPNLGRTAALAAALVFLFSPYTLKQIALARSDAVFGFFVFLTALLAWRASHTGRGWTGFWLAAAAATLTKGPLGLVLAAGGLVYRFSIPKTERKPVSVPAHLPGIVLYLVLCVGWFALAYAVRGDALVAKMLGQELAGHMTGSGEGKLPLVGFYKPTLYFLSRFAPWSLLTGAGLWMVWKWPAESTDARHFGRFLAAFFLFGLVLFSIPGHQRADHLWPLIPAAALLAGRAAAAWLERLAPAGRRAVFAAVVLLCLTGAGVYGHVIAPRSPAVQETERLTEFAHRLRKEVGSGFPFIHVHSPYYLQFVMGSHRRDVSPALAAEALRSDNAAYVLIERDDKGPWEEFERHAGDYEVLERIPLREEHELLLVGNRPRLGYAQEMATVVDGLVLEMDGAHLLESGDGELTFRTRRPHGEVRITNRSGEAQSVDVTFRNTFPRQSESAVLAPEDTWSHRFAEPVAPDAALRVGLISDCRQAYGQLEWLAETRAFEKVDYILVNGDFVFEQDWRFDRFLKQAERFERPLFAICGNHDIVKDSPFEYESFMNRFGYLTTTFDDGPARFVLLETGHKIIGEKQFEFMTEVLPAEPRPPVRLLLHHVPPSRLRTPEDSYEGEASDKTEMNRLLATAAEYGVDRIYCGHQNVYETRDYETPHGPMQVVVSGGGGEKTGESDYGQHWLLLTISPAGIVEEYQPIEVPAWSERVWAHIQHRDLFVAGRYGPAVVMVMLLMVAGWLLAKRTARAVGR